MPNGITAPRNPVPNFEQELAIATEACRAAGTIQLDCRNRAKRVEIKDDASPVTQVDKACEKVVVETLTRHFPRDGFLGEEQGEQQGQSGRRWIIDPLDGTRPYIRGIPTYGVLVALEESDRVVVGVIHLPELGLTCYARKGGGAFCNGSRIHVSSVADPGAAIGSALGFVECADTDEGRRLFSLMKRWDYRYGFMDVYSYVCVACGKLDLCVNLLDKPWDNAAASCIVAEAGGEFSDIRGEPSVYSGSTVLTNGLLHDAVVDSFRS